MPLGFQHGYVELIGRHHFDIRGQLLDFFVGIHAFHGGPIAVFVEQVFGERGKIGQLGKGAAGDHIYFFVVDGFHTAGGHGNVAQAQLNHGLLQEGGFFGVGVEQGDLQVGSADGGGNAGHAAAGAYVHQGFCLFHIGQQGEAVKNVAADDLVVAAQGGEVVSAVPLLQQRGVFEQQKLLGGGKIEAEGGKAFLQLLFVVHKLRFRIKIRAT